MPRAQRSALACATFDASKKERTLIDRRACIGAGLALAASGALPAEAKSRKGIVGRQGTRLVVDGRRYRFVGANMWSGAYLGADGPFGNRDRLRRELDALVATGVTNLRLLASAEEGPLKNSVRPAFRTAAKSYDPTLLAGLDYCLAEMGQRGIKGVLYLTNFWEWSGGMMTYLSYVNGGQYIDMNDPAHPWPEFADRTSAFYSTPAAVALYHDYVRSVVGRTNTITGQRYADDPAIMAWQLANEPRPGGSEAVGRRNLPAFTAWVRGTARLIKSIDPNHLVSTGSEGLKGSLEDAAIYTQVHQAPEIDYCTAHVWPLNWTWVDDKDLAGTEKAGAAKVADYLDSHVALARQIGKPLVIEEFGFPRDVGYSPSASTAFRDRYYQQIYAAVMAGTGPNGPVAGSNFWGWGGEGRAEHPDFRFQRGDHSYLGDPPHEPQGWYSVFDTDNSTRAIIRDHAAALARLT
jgi:mannan endo-1,4-beta-mannosidase